MSENKSPVPHPDAAPRAADRSNGQRTAIITLSVLAVVAIAVALFMMFGRGGGTPPAQSSSPAASTSTSASASTSDSPSATPSSSASASPTPSTSPTAPSSSSPTPLPEAEAKNVVWPNPSGIRRYSTPEDAVKGFAEDLVGFTNAVYGEVQQGDSRSGEISIRNEESSSAITTVMFRQMSDGYFYVIAAVSSEINPQIPEAGTQVSSPVAVSGTSRAFEAVVNVHVYAHGTPARIGEGIVMGGSMGTLEPFSGDINFTNPGSGTGAVVFLEFSAKDGSVYAAAAAPVTFKP